MKKAILFAIVVIIIAFLFFNTQAKAYEPRLHIATSITEAETYESVLIMITSDPLEYQDNLTISSNHTIDLEFYNLGTSEVIYKGNVTLKYGTATWSFMVVPEWGEFTGIIKISDPLINSETSIPIEISYSTDYIIYKHEQHDSMENEKNLALILKTVEDVWNFSFAVIGIISLFTLITLVKLDHTTKTKVGEESLWERFSFGIWPFQESTSMLTRYALSDDYRHPTEARKHFEVTPLMAKLARADRDMEDVLYRQQAYTHAIREIEPNALPEISPDMTLQDLENEMDQQINEEN